MRRSPNLRGFTLLEVMLSVIIAVMVMAVAVPSVNGLLEERRMRASFEAFDALVGKALERSLAEREPQRIVWQRDRIVIAAGATESPSADAPGIAVSREENYQVEFPAALTPKPEPEWTIWPTGTCEPVIVHYKGPEGKWSAVYDPLTVMPKLSTDES